MMLSLSSNNYFEIISEVTESWDKVKRIPHYSELVGATLFTRMYEIGPDEWSAYSFSKHDIDNKTEAFVAFAMSFARMVDVTVNMLGPDLELVQEELYDLGVYHERFEVMPHHYELMGKALLYTLEQVLDPKSFTPTTKRAWSELFAFMSETMMEGEADCW